MMNSVGAADLAGTDGICTGPSLMGRDIRFLRLQKPFLALCNLIRHDRRRDSLNIVRSLLNNLNPAPY